MGRTQVERRRHKRFELPCTITLISGEGRVLAKTKTLNIADGGVFLAVPSQAAPARGANLSLEFSVPRSTANTYMLEQFSCQGQVIRHQGTDGEGLCGIALMFTPPVDLVLEV